MKVIFISGPYRGDSIDDNIDHASDIAQRLWKTGWAVICPHMNSMHFEEDSRFLSGYLEILSRCDAIYMLRGWAQSEGAREELRVAKANGLQVMYEL